jgi:hypothetical protein
MAKFAKSMELNGGPLSLSNLLGMPCVEKIFLSFSFVCLHAVEVTTKRQRQEPLKMTEIPQNPWEVVSVDFGGPYPDPMLCAALITFSCNVLGTMI